jgi:hypothetical protein
VCCLGEKERFDACLAPEICEDGKANPSISKFKAAQKMYGLLRQKSPADTFAFHDFEIEFLVKEDALRSERIRQSSRALTSSDNSPFHRHRSPSLLTFRYAAASNVLFS